MEIKTIKTSWGSGEMKQNTYVVEGDKTCVVIDAGAQLWQVQELTDKPIEAVFITHGHFDHVDYIEEYDKLGVPIYASKHLKDVLFDEILNVSGHKSYKVKNIVTIEDDNVIEALTGDIKCMETPGHSEDSMCYLLNNQILFSGDTVFSIAVGRTDLPTGNSKELIKSLNRILNLDYITLFTGHGRPSDKQEQNKNIPKWIDYLTKKGEQNLCQR